MKTLLVTGGAGFIGSNFVRFLLEHTQDQVVILDKLTYAGSLLNLEGCLPHERIRFVEGDIQNRAIVKALFEKHRFAGVVNFAAETHVDRSIDNPSAFIDTNILGVFSLLEEARHYHQTLTPAQKELFRFLHISTDEVYGSLGADGTFSESTPFAPNSPYSASKAAGDHLVRAYYHTYSLPTLVTHCSNNYGPYQFPEKLIPLMILNAVERKSLPIYGDGGNIRDWIYVTDHCAAINMVLNRGRPGEKYNIGARTEKNNLAVVDTICSELNKIFSDRPDHRELKTFVVDRPGHDRRYAIDSNKIERELGWKPAMPFDKGIAETIRWYLSHRDWCEKIQKGKYNRERLGVK